MVRHQRDAVETAYRTAMAKLAYSGESDVDKAEARALYDKLMADKAADDIDEDIANWYRTRRRVGTLGALASIPVIGYGLHTGMKNPASALAAGTVLGGGLLGVTGLIDRGIGEGKLKRYYNDRDFRRYKNVGYRLAETEDRRNLAAHDILVDEWKALKAKRKAEAEAAAAAAGE